MEAQSGMLTFPWGLSPLSACLGAQLRHPQVHFVVLSTLSHSAENHD